MCDVLSSEILDAARMSSILFENSSHMLARTTRFTFRDQNEHTLTQFELISMPFALSEVRAELHKEFECV